MHYLQDVFGPGGLFAGKFKNYEPRPGQVQLATAIDQAMASGKHLLGDAPCGIGKSVAYGVPATWHAAHQDRKVVITTANIALQEQLIGKDLPMLADLLPWKFSYALLKGRNNYLCLRRADALCAADENRLNQEQLEQLNRIWEWAGETETGDQSELEFLPDPLVWSWASSSADDCLGKKCAFRDDCWAEQARMKARESQIVVTNYHLLFAHLQVLLSTGQHLILPKYTHLVLDEVHEAADIARGFFGFSLSTYVPRKIADVVEPWSRKAADDLRRAAESFFDQVDAVAGDKPRLRRPGFANGDDLLQQLDRAMGYLEDNEEVTDGTDTPRTEAQLISAKTCKSIRKYQSNLREALALDDPDKVYFVEYNARHRTKIVAKLVVVAPTFKTLVWEQAPTVCVSATAAAAGRFDFLRREIGAPNDAVEVQVQSPFDFQHQSLLVLQPGMPDPKSPVFIGELSRVFELVVLACRGRVLGLFTSYRNLNSVYDAIKARTSYRVLRQGDLPRTELTRIFKEDTNSVLLGTDSFWQGIDVPGEALTGLVVDKLPFPNMGDPVVESICERDPDSFSTYLLPQAIVMLRQGVGRLIRTQTDFGVVVICDPRLVNKRYGQDFLRSLPPMPTIATIETIQPFLASRQQRS